VSVYQATLPLIPASLFLPLYAHGEEAMLLIVKRLGLLSWPIRTSCDPLVPKPG
jgi:hypothetical protein